MSHFNLCVSYLLIMIIIYLQADIVYSQDEEDISQDVVSSYVPSLPVVVGVLCFMFLLTIALLLYTKFCCRRVSHSRADQQILPGHGLPEPRFSGIDRKVIESLPFFEFSSLKGSKEGLECAVCLSRFEDIEILRMLPKCRHAFHIHCIDQWLEKHSTCPLCRQIVSAMDLTSFNYSGSIQFPGKQSDSRQDSDMELFVQREEEHQGSSRFSIGGSFRKLDKFFKQDELLIKESAGTRSDHQEVFHKFNHSIVVSDILYKNRWSSVNSSDFVFLKEMFNTNSGSRFPDLGSANRKLTSNSGYAENDELNEHNPDIPSTSSNTNAQENSIQMSKYVNPGEKRSMSEITGLSRYEDSRMKNKIGVSGLLENNVKNERLRQLWLPIARRTVRWFANKERSSNSQASQGITQYVDA